MLVTGLVPLSAMRRASKVQCCAAAGCGTATELTDRDPTIAALSRHDAPPPALRVPRRFAPTPPARWPLASTARDSCPHLRHSPSPRRPRRRCISRRTSWPSGMAPEADAHVACVAGTLHEGLDEHGGRLVARGPVGRQLAADEGGDVRAEVGDADPGQDQEARQEARVVDDERQSRAVAATSR